MGGLKGGECPPGWSYNPSAWGERLPLVAAAVGGFVIAGYLSLYQFDIVATVWEPFFGGGSATVLNSPISRLLPIPDAALGALGYLLDALTGSIGGRSRWRRMPWMVVIFGLAVGPLGAISILLVILQPVLYEAWCTLCLTTAVISVVMIGPALDELLASLQYLRWVQEQGGSLWRAFWGAETALYEKRFTGRYQEQLEPEEVSAERLQSERQMASRLHEQE